MLALTQNAAEAVQSMIDQPDVPESAVVRITAAGEGLDAESAELQLALVEEPEESDVLVEGMPISVERETVALLEDKVLDAEIADGAVTFSLFLQPQPSSMNGAAPPV